MDFESRGKQKHELHAQAKTSRWGPTIVEEFELIRHYIFMWHEHSFERARKLQHTSSLPSAPPRGQRLICLLRLRESHACGTRRRDGGMGGEKTERAGV